MMNPNPTISIGIVIFQENVNMLAQVFVHLKTAISNMSSTQFEIYIVDNHPSSQLELPLKKLAESTILHEKNALLKYIKTGKNIGYGAANNLAIRACQSDYHLIMNPDVFVSADAFLKAIAYMQTHQEVALLTPSVFSVDQTRQHLCKQNPTLFDMFLRGFSPNFIRKLFDQKISRFEMREKDYDQEINDVPFPTGCFMFVRTEVLKQIGGFDEQFFLYFEDADLGRRILAVSHSAYVPEVKIVHQWARESRKQFKMFCIMIRSGFLYWRKHGGVF